MSRFGHLARRYGFDALIVLAAVEAALEVALRDDPPRAPQTPLWFAVPAVALIVLPLLAPPSLPVRRARRALAARGRALVRRRAAGRVRVRRLRRRHGRRLPARQPARRRAGAHRPGHRASAARRSSSTTTRTARAGEFVFIPLLFAIAWLAGFALRERAAQAEAAEERATQAEREREAAARIAVAEERARIARELHDIVAHAVSVMVLQVGAVRHKLPETLGRGQRCAHGRRAGRPHGARRDAPPPRRDARRRRGRRARAPARPRQPRRAASRRSAAPAFPCGCTSRATPSRSRARSISPPTGSSRRA